MNELMLLKYLKDNFGIKASHTNSVSLKENAGIFYFIVTDYYFDYFVGEGKTIKEACMDIKQKGSVYGNEFKDTEQIRNLPNAYFIYKPDSPVETKSISEMYGKEAETFYSFCDYEDYKTFYSKQRRMRAFGFHTKILKKTKGIWVDVTSDF